MIRPAALRFLALALFLGIPGLAAPASFALADGPRVLFDFDPSNPASNWSNVDDVVMGGVSKSGFAVGSDGTARFSGVVSLENNGGFCSVRSGDLPARALEGGKGLILRVKGDGKSYGVTIRTRGTLEVYSWRAPLEIPKAGEWVEVRVPFEKFRPTLFGNTVPNDRSIDPAAARYLSFVISDKQAGSFALDVDWIKVDDGSGDVGVGVGGAAKEAGAASASSSASRD